MIIRNYNRKYNYRKIALIVTPVLLLIILSAVRFSSGHTEKGSAVNLTAEERNWLTRNPHKLNLLFNIEFPPIEFSSPSGTFTGIGADVIAMIEGRLGVTFAKKPSDDWNRHLSALEEGTCAIAPTIVRTAERERFAFFTVPYATVPVVIIGSRDSPAGITLDDLAGRRVAVVSGYASEKYLHDRAQDRFRVVPLLDVPEGLRAVSFGQVDAYVENLAVAAYYINKEGISNLRVVGRTDYEFAFSIGVSRQYPLLYSAIQKALDTIPDSELETIRNRWISLQVHRGLNPETISLIKLIAVFTVMLLLGLTGISYILKRMLKEKIESLRTAKQELLDQTERLCLALEATKAGIWDYDPATERIYLNEQWYTMLGYSPGPTDVTLGEWSMYIHPEDILITKDTLKDYIDSGGNSEFEAEFRMRKADTSWCWILGKGRAVAWDENQNPTRIIGLNLNIQTIKEVREAMAFSEMRFRSLFTMAPLPLAELSEDGSLIEVNDRFKKVIGYTADEVPTLEHWWKLAYPDPDHRHLARLTWQNATKKSREGSPDMKSGEFRVTCKDGTVRTMIIGTSLIGNSILVSFFDITKHKQAEEEREKLQGQLVQSQKLEAIGVLAGGVAHDFNNMLGAIIGYAELTMSKMDAADPYRRNLGKILDAANRSAALTRQLLAFARKQTVTPIVFDLNESVEAMLKMLRRLIGENIDLVWQPGTGRLNVKMDPSQLDQILANLCVNARDAIKDVGRITIQTDTASFNEMTCSFYADCIPGDYVKLSVSDNGSGMDKETASHIFEPFFTTKGLGHGTGLGLSTVYGIVKQNEGFINLYTEPGTGATFTIYIPCHADETAVKRETITDDIQYGQGETILIVEDDPILMEMGEMMLQRLGYSVLSAASPGDAIALVEEKGSGIQLFLTDVVMPEMNGRELADRLLAIRPGIKHLFMSGYTADVIVHRGVLDEGVNFLQKPFSIKELAAKIRSVLDTFQTIP
ncbi:MAG: transporter substrate-binding domain-containing protein [Pseudomonadota bacterium]